MKEKFSQYYEESDAIRENQGNSRRFTDPKKKLETINDRAWRTTLRIFRGFHNLSQGGRYFPKDKAYFEGGYHAETLAQHGLDDYLTKFKVDPALVDSFHKWGMEALNPIQVKQVAEKFFKDEIEWFFK